MVILDQTRVISVIKTTECFSHFNNEKHYFLGLDLLEAVAQTSILWGLNFSVRTIYPGHNCLVYCMMEDINFFVVSWERHLEPCADLS